MYKQKLSEAQKDRLRRGDTKLLITLLEASDANVIKELKAHKGDVAFLQGISYIIDKLIEVLGTR